MSVGPTGSPAGGSPEPPGPGANSNTRRWAGVAFVAGLVLGFLVTLLYLMVR